MPYERQTSPRNAFDHVPVRASLVFYTAVFCVFAPWALIFDLASPIGLSWKALLFWSVYMGLTSVGWAYAFTRNLRFLWINIPLSFLIGSLYGDMFYVRPNLGSAAGIEVALCIGTILIGYICFVVFISREGTKTVRLQTEINLAKEIHDHLVPSVDRATERVELYGMCLPASEVGGDLMDVCVGGGRTGVYVADVTGHGVPAGVSMGMIKSAIRMKLRERPPLRELVSGLNDVVVQTQRAGTLVTFAALEIHDDGRVVYALAGHLPILHARAGTGTVDLLANAHPPLGVFEGRAYGDAEVAAAPGDVFVILTDGLTEVFDAEGREFGVERVASLVAGRRSRPLAEIHKAVLEAARAFGPQADDQTLLLARIR